MQITVALPDDNNSAEAFSLRLFYLDGDDRPPMLCSLCDSRDAVWYAPPASSAVLDPKTSPIGSGDACADDMNRLIADGTVVVVHVDPHSL